MEFHFLLLMDVVIAFVLDAIIGDPKNLPHPVILIGKCIKKMEKHLWPMKRKLLSGGILTFLTVVLTTCVVGGSLLIAYRIHPILFHLLNIGWTASGFAMKCLADEGMAVHDALERSVGEGRSQVAMLVGRDTSGLSEREVVRATVETVAENYVDGVLSVAFFACLGVLSGAAAVPVWIFKAASTLDSMVGYKNERYLLFGRISARLDDVMNFIPARLSGVLIPLAAAVSGFSWMDSVRIVRRDHRNHSSPNCAWPESAFAGAMGVQLGGNNVYFGKVVEKPTLGDSIRPLTKMDILSAVRLMRVSSCVAYMVLVMLTCVLIVLKVG